MKSQRRLISWGSNTYAVQIEVENLPWCGYPVLKAVASFWPRPKNGLRGICTGSAVTNSVSLIRCCADFTSTLGCIIANQSSILSGEKCNVSGATHYGDVVNAIACTGAISIVDLGSIYLTPFRPSIRQSDRHPARAAWGARCGKSARRVLRGGTGTRG